MYPKMFVQFLQQHAQRLEEGNLFTIIFLLTDNRIIVNVKGSYHILLLKYMGKPANICYDQYMS